MGASLPRIESGSILHIASRHRGVPTRSSIDGFTVLEVLIACVILALGIAALSGAVSDSLLRTARAKAYAQSVQVADGLLARLGADIPVRPGNLSGRGNGVDWEIAIRPYGTDDDRAAWPVQTAEVAVTLRWTAGRRGEIGTWRTLRPVDKSGTGK
jgi:type II secretory pathway component PulJ